jgi:hypothetical protein
MTKNNIILDLDNTIISCLTNNQKNASIITSLKEKINNYSELQEHKIIKYIIFERNNLKEFFDYIFEYFNVSIWTAATRRYTSFIISNIFKDRKIDYVFFDYHVNLSKKLYDNNMKHIDLLTKTFKIESFNYNNTIIIDNLDNIANENMPYKSYKCVPFNIIEQINSYDNDNELLNIINHVSKIFNTPQESIPPEKVEPIPPEKVEPIPQEKVVEPIPQEKVDKYEGLPEGWKRVESRSRPGKFSYENIYTEERIPEMPKYDASRFINQSKDLKFYD